MTEKYPYFIYPDVIALKSCTDQEETIRLRRRIAANVGDRAALRIIFGMDPEEFSRFYPDMSPVTLSTADTIDSFLSHFGNPDAPVSQATAEIGMDLTRTSDSRQEIPQEKIFEEEIHEEEIPAPHTEQDARECIKNHDYQKALEIIMRLHLNNPEKSIYFADQIRFLRKLILNQERQNNENS